MKDMLNYLTAYCHLYRSLSCSCCQPQVLQRDNKVDVGLEQRKSDLNKLEAGTLHANDSKSEDNGEKHSDTATNTAPPATAPAEPYAEYLNFVPESSEKIKYLTLSEEDFWKWLIETYLYPGEKDHCSAEEEEKRLKEQEKVKEELKELRNKASLAYLLINALFITVIYFLQQSNVDTGGGLSVRIECGNGDELVLEPISLAFTAVAGILLAIQFVCMLIHRSKTFLQINSITEIKQDEVDKYVKMFFYDAAKEVMNEKPEKEDIEPVAEEKKKSKDSLKQFIAENVLKKLNEARDLASASHKENIDMKDADGIKATSSTNKDSKNKFRKTVSSVIINMSQEKKQKLLENDSFIQLEKCLLKAAERSGAVQPQNGAINVNGPNHDKFLDGKDDDEAKQRKMQIVVDVFQSSAPSRANDSTISQQTTA